MPGKKHRPEEIVAKLRQVDVLLSQGQSVGESVRMACPIGWSSSVHGSCFQIVTRILRAKIRELLITVLGTSVQNHHISAVDVRMDIAHIIFLRLSGQISGDYVTEKTWNTMVTGWVENPALFPLVETCMDAAEEILTYVRQNTSARPI